MDYTKLFYWLVVADNAKVAFVGFAVAFGILAFISIVGFIAMTQDGSREDANKARKWVQWSTPFFVIFILLSILTPSKKDSLLIVAGGGTLNFLTTDSSAKQIPHELSNFVVTELKNMATDAKIDLNIKDQKQKVLDDIKTLSAEELIKKMKEDDSVRKLILDEK